VLLNEPANSQLTRIVDKAEQGRKGLYEAGAGLNALRELEADNAEVRGR
jgi:hypothetical protein